MALLHLLRPRRISVVYALLDDFNLGTFRREFNWYRIASTNQIYLIKIGSQGEERSRSFRKLHRRRSSLHSTVRSLNFVTRFLLTKTADLLATYASSSPENTDRLIDASPSQQKPKKPRPAKKKKGQPPQKPKPSPAVASDKQHKHKPFGEQSDEELLNRSGIILAASPIAQCRLASLSVSVSDLVCPLSGAVRWWCGAVVLSVCMLLKERNRELVCEVMTRLGRKSTVGALLETLTIEKGGGMLVQDYSRRR